MEEKNRIQFCLNLVAKKATKLSEADWTDQTFIELSEILDKETGVLIGRTVLKRLYGKLRTSEDYRPQKEVRNALARYVGFENWNDFTSFYDSQDVSSQPQDEFNQDSSEKTDQGLSQKIGNEPGELGAKETPVESNKWIAGVVMLGIIVAVLFYWKTNPSKSMPDPNFGRNVLSMELMNPADTVPYTQTVSYTLDPPGEVGFFVDSFSIKPFSNQIQINQTDPGYRYLNFHRGGEVLIRKAFHNLSRGWVCLAETEKGNLYLPDHFYKEKGIARLKRDESDVPDSNFSAEEPAFLHFHQSRNFGFTGDTIKVDFSIKLAEASGPGFDFYLKLSGDSGVFETKIWEQSLMKYNEILLTGPKGSSLAFSPQISIPKNKWIPIVLENSKNSSQLYFSNKLVWSQNTALKLGELKAIQLSLKPSTGLDFIRICNKKNVILDRVDF